MKNYFTDRELACKCCGELIVDPIFLELLNKTREIYGGMMVINSGHRCKKHNADVGSTTENHVLGKAVDVKCLTSLDRSRMIYAAMKAGMPGIGVQRDFIHMDNNRDYPALWVY